MTSFGQIFYGFGWLVKICFFVQVFCLSFISCIQKFKISIKKRVCSFLEKIFENIKLFQKINAWEEGLLLKLWATKK
tara:strand:+ start:1924 stop:2154 length:231 start_codon:yes stop_codon:yes gene_type:complete